MRRMIKDKKAQITIFIILGVVIVAAASIFFLMRGEPEELPAEIAAAERTPDEFKPIKDFIETCLNQKLKEAFITIGQHGGYIDMSDPEVSGSLFTLDPSDPTSSDAAFMGSDISSHVPYWWYLQTDNKCSNCFLTDGNKPSFDYIQTQSDKYIKNNIAECINEFRSFERQGFEIDALSDPIPETTITEDEIVVFMDYRVNATLNGKSSEMSKYYTKIPLNFREYYELANAITNAEIDTGFLEFVVKQMLGIYTSGADSNKLPPIYFKEKSYVPKVWSRTLVKMNFESLLSSHVPLLSLKGTKNALQITNEDPLINGLYRNFYYENLLNKSYDDFIVNFYYLEWPDRKSVV